MPIAILYNKASTERSTHDVERCSGKPSNATISNVYQYIPDVSGTAIYTYIVSSNAYMYNTVAVTWVSVEIMI